MENFNKHNVKWTEEKIKNFWDYFVVNNGLLELSFARETGKAIIKIVEKYIKKDGNNLDYGCGAGYLMGYLFKQGIFCSGLDASEASLEEVKKKFENNKFFKEIILANEIPNKNINDNSYDFIFSLEMIEHILPEQLNSTLEEFYRILKPGGHVFISTPSNENLDKYKVICPDCGSVFHRVQHVNSFSEEKLSKLMKEIGFNKIKCESVLLKNTHGLVDKIKWLFNFVRTRIFSRKKFTPHLIYLGKK